MCFVCPVDILIPKKQPRYFVTNTSTAHCEDEDTKSVLLPSNVSDTLAVEIDKLTIKAKPF